MRYSQLPIEELISFFLSRGGTRLASHRLYTSREEARPSSVKLTIGEEDYELSGNK